MYSFAGTGLCVIEIDTTNLAKTCVNTVCKVRIVQGYASSNAAYDHDEPCLRKRRSEATRMMVSLEGVFPTLKRVLFAIYSSPTNIPQRFRAFLINIRLRARDALPLKVLFNKISL